MAELDFRDYLGLLPHPNSYSNFCLNRQHQFSVSVSLTPTSKMLSPWLTCLKAAVIYQVESSTAVLLLLIYSKSDQEDVTAGEIRGAIDES
jgi:hypothetical protein